MTPIATTLEESVRRIGEAHGEPGWLRDLRAQAREAYASAPAPDRAAHLWRYTPAEPFVPKDGGAGRGGDAGSGAASDWPEPIARAWEGGTVSAAAFVRGARLVRAALSPEAAKAGILLMDLHAAAARHPDLVRPHFGSLAGAAFGKFEALNAAAWEGGLFLYVPRDVHLAAPVHVVRDAGAAGGAAMRLLAVVEDGAAATLVDELAGGGGAPGTDPANGVVETVAGAGADVRYVGVQRLDPEAVAHLTQRTRLGRDAKLLLVHAALGGATVKSNLGAILEGRGAESRLLGIAVGDGRQHLDHHTVHDHRAPDTRTDLHFRVVLRGSARSVYTGLIRIAREAVNADAYQENRNLLLDPEARADSIPELEILTDAVRCTHGVTMGPVDPEQVYYLMARGIARTETVRLIVAGFVEPTLDRMPVDLRARMRRAVAERLGIEALPGGDGD
jgi:Fe-S cluster assembly protein SufD